MRVEEMKIITSSPVLWNQTVRKMPMAKITETPRAHHKLGPTRPNHARFIKALLSNDMKRRSPLVVSKRKMPILGFPPGEKYSQTPIATNKLIILAQNRNVGIVHAIHDKAMSFPLYTRPRAKPLAM